jgi:predicted nucleic acid-binding protein
VKVLVDSTVWSLAMRRSKTTHHPHLIAFNEIIRENRAVLIGPVRQEILSGIRSQSQFRKLQELLRAWTDVLVETRDYEHAAEHFNSCRARGIQGTHTDFLICAIAERHNLTILTTDKDFAQYAAILPIKLFLPP